MEIARKVLDELINQPNYLKVFLIMLSSCEDDGTVNIKNIEISQVLMSPAGNIFGKVSYSPETVKYIKRRLKKKNIILVEKHRTAIKNHSSHKNGVDLCLTKEDVFNMDEFALAIYVLCFMKTVDGKSNNVTVWEIGKILSSRGRARWGIRTRKYMKAQISRYPFPNIKIDKNLNISCLYDREEVAKSIIRAIGKKANVKYSYSESSMNAIKKVLEDFTENDIMDYYNLVYNHYQKGALTKKQIHPKLLTKENLRKYKNGELVFKDNGASDDAQKILDALNKAVGRAGKNCFPMSGGTRTMIEDILRHQPPYKIEDMAFMFYRKKEQWKGTKFAEYLRPQTLLRSDKFHGYMKENIPPQYSSKMKREHILNSILGDNNKESDEEKQYEDFSSLVNDDVEEFEL